GTAERSRGGSGAAQASADADDPRAGPRAPARGEYVRPVGARPRRLLLARVETAPRRRVGPGVHEALVRYSCAAPRPLRRPSGTPTSFSIISVPASQPRRSISLTLPRWPIRKTLPFTSPSPTPSDSSSRRYARWTRSSESTPGGITTAVSVF